jgi:hypothetical protein
MNQYSCKTCEYHSFKKEPDVCHLCSSPTIPKEDKLTQKIGVDEYCRIYLLGCASHSKFQYDPKSTTCKYCAARKQPVNTLIEFDMWVSSHHVCGKYAKVSEVRQWIHNKIAEISQKVKENVDL